MDFDGIVIRIDPGPAVAAQAKVDQGFARNEESARRMGGTTARAYDQAAAAAKKAARDVEENARAQTIAAERRAKVRAEADRAASAAARRAAAEQASAQAKLADAYREIVGPAAQYNEKLRQAIALERQGAISAKQRADYVRQLGHESKAFAAKRGGGLGSITSAIPIAGAGPAAAAVAGVAIASGAIRSVVEMGDKYTLLLNRIKTVTASEAEAKRVREQLIKISNRTRIETSATVEVYARLASAGQALGKSQREVLTFTESLNKAVKLSGATSQEAQAGLIQLAQGLGSGALRGDELRSVLEQLPAVADVIAKSLGVTRGQLRKLGEDGKITADVVFKAFKDARGELDQKFAKSAMTVTDAWTVLRNKLEEAVGKLVENTNLIPMLVKGIEALGNGLVYAVREFEALVSILGKVKSVAKPVLEVMSKLGGGVVLKLLKGASFSNINAVLSGDVKIGWKTATDSMVGAARGYMEAAEKAAEQKVAFEKKLAAIFMASKEGQDLDRGFRQGAALLGAWSKKIGGLVTGEDPYKAQRDAEKEASQEAIDKRKEVAAAYAALEGQLSGVVRANQQLAEAEKTVEDAVRRGVATREEATRVMAAYRASLADQLDPYTAQIKAMEEEIRALGLSKDVRERWTSIAKVENDLRAKGVALTVEQSLRIGDLVIALEKARAANENVVNWSERAESAGRRFADTLRGVGESVFQAGAAVDEFTSDLTAKTDAIAQAWGSTFGDAARSGLDAIVDFAITGRSTFSEMTASILADIAKLSLRLLALQALQAAGIGGGGGFGAALVGALGGGINLGNNATGGTYRVPPIGPTGGDSVPFFGRAMPGERITITPANANAQATAPAPVHLAPIIVHDAQAAALAAMRTPAGTRAVIAMVGSDPAGFRSALGLG